MRGKKVPIEISNVVEISGVLSPKFQVETMGGCPVVKLKNVTGMLRTGREWLKSTLAFLAASTVARMSRRP